MGVVTNGDLHWLEHELRTEQSYPCTGFASKKSMILISLFVVRSGNDRCYSCPICQFPHDRDSCKQVDIGQVLGDDSHLHSSYRLPLGADNKHETFSTNPLSKREKNMVGERAERESYYHEEQVS